MQNFYIVGYKVIVPEFVIYRDAEILHSSLGKIDAQGQKTKSIIYHDAEFLHGPLF